MKRFKRVLEVMEEDWDGERQNLFMNEQHADKQVILAIFFT